MASIPTTLGARSSNELGFILPHEHIFVDLRTWDVPGYAQADTQDVVRLMAPELTRAKEAGVTAIVTIQLSNASFFFKAIFPRWRLRAAAIYTGPGYQPANKLFHLNFP